MKFDTKFKIGQSVWIITVCTKGKLNTEIGAIDKIIVKESKLFYTFSNSISLNTLFSQLEIEEQFLALNLNDIPELYRQLIFELDPSTGDTK